MAEPRDPREELVDVLAETIVAMFLRETPSVPGNDAPAAVDRPRVLRTKASRR